jgi:hypothetical protein
MGALGLGLSLRQRGGFSPRLLFADGSAGAWYDPSDLSTMAQNGDGSGAAALDAPVGRILDKSGRGNHAVQAAAASRPMLRRENGLWFLEFDGNDDWLRAAFACGQPYERVSAIRQLSWTVNDRIFDGVTANSQLFQSSASPDLRTNDGFSSTPPVSSAGVGVNAVVSERHDNAGSRLAVNNLPPVTGTTGSNNPGGITIAATTGGGGCGHIRLYGACMIARALKDGEALRLRRFMAARAGVAL